MKSPNDVHGLQAQPEGDRELEQPRPPRTHQVGVRAEEIGEEKSDASRDLEHVVVERGFVGEVGAASRPTSHSAGGGRGVSADGSGHVRRQTTQTGQDRLRLHGRPLVGEVRILHGD